MVKPPIPLNVEALAQRLLTPALHLEEDSANCLANADIPNFDAMMLSARQMFEALEAFFEELRK